MSVGATRRIRGHRQRIVRRVASRFGKLRSNGMSRPPENNPSSSQHTPAAWRTLPAGIWALGFGSLFMDTSSEMIHSLLPIFMVTARFVDRIGKGIRGAPRDALGADIAPAHMRGAAYGLRQALDSIGALLGPLLAVGFMIWLADDIRTVMWIAVVPAFIAAALLMIYVREPERAPAPGHIKAPLTFADARRLSRRYWMVVLVGAVFTLARFSEAFLVLRAENIGLALSYVPVVMVVMNVFYAAAAFPAGAAADRFPPRPLLLIGLALLIAADAVLAIAADAMAVFVGAALWGLHMAFTQGLLSKLVADTVPEQLRGTVFCIFNLVSGCALLLASVIAGALWSAIGPAATFLAGAGFAGIAAFGIVTVNRRSARSKQRTGGSRQPR